MANFELLCKRIIDKNGNITVEDTREADYFDHNFEKLRMLSPERLVKNARQALHDRGIYYKEVYVNEKVN